MIELAELHKLHQIPFCPSPIRIHQLTIIIIQPVHLREIPIPNPNDNQADRQLTTVNNLADNSLHIMNVPISQYQQNNVLVHFPLNLPGLIHRIGQ